MDSIGLGISKTKLMYFNIAKFPIKGIICSSNDIGVISNIIYIILRFLK